MSFLAAWQGTCIFGVRDLILQYTWRRCEGTVVAQVMFAALALWGSVSRKNAWIQFQSTFSIVLLRKNALKTATIFPHADELGARLFS